MVQTFLDQPYGDDPLQRLDLYTPESGTDAPLIFFIHGGAWISGDKSEHASTGRRFAREGFAFAAVNYRLSTAPRVKSPDHAADAALAYAWLVSHAAGQAYSTSKIFLLGHSAGAHNCGLLVTSNLLRSVGVPEASFPRGAVGLEGIYDIPGLIERWPGYEEWFIAKAIGERSRWAGESPCQRPIELKAPWLIIHSNEDELVDEGQSDRFATHLEAQRVRVSRETISGNHDEVVLSLDQPSNATAKMIQGFIRQNLGSRS